MYLQQFPDSAIAINLKACNHFRLYNGKAAEAELKALQDMASPSFQFAQDLIKHNLVRRLHKQTHVHCCSFGRGEFSSVPLNVCVLFRFSWCVCVISFIRVHVHAALIVMVHYVPRLFKIRVFFLYTECFVYRVYNCTCKAIIWHIILTCLLLNLAYLSWSGCISRRRRITAMFAQAH